MSVGCDNRIIHSSDDDSLLKHYSLHMVTYVDGHEIGRLVIV